MPIAIVYPGCIWRRIIVRELDYRLYSPVLKAQYGISAVEEAAEAGKLGMKVEVNPPTMIAEDFSRYLKLAPGAMFRIGTGGGYDNHHPAFTADPTALLPAAKFFAALAEGELTRLKG